MNRTRSLHLALISAAAVALAGCDDGTSPVDLGGLDADELVAAVNGLVDPLQASSEAVANLEAARPDLADAGLDLEWNAEATIQFPEDVVGSTFVYDATTTAWTIDESRTGAPADGVRVIWYSLDGSGAVIESAEQGHMDLRPAPGGTAPIAIRVEENATTVSEPRLDFVQDYSWTGNGVEVEAFEAAGSYSSDLAIVTFSLDSEETVETASGDADYSYTAIMEDVDTRYGLNLVSTNDGATGTFEDVVTSTVERDGVTTVVEVRYQGSGGIQQDATGFVRHAGVTVATVHREAGGIVFRGPDGETLSAAQASELNALFQALTFNGIILLFQLPLLYPAV